MIKPIDRSNSPSKYYRINKEKKATINIKILRFIVRYLIPVIVIAASIVVSDMFIFNKELYNTTKDITVVVIGTLVVSFIAAIIANLWFKMITKKQTEE